MFLPKIKFREMFLEENIDFIKDAYFDDNGVLSLHDLTINYFPELVNIDLNLSIDEVYKKIEEVVTNDYNKYHEMIKKETIRYNILWKKYNDEYFEMLSSFFCVNWPNNIGEITVSVGLIPVFPRYLDKFSFSVGIEIEDQRLLTVCAHETLHFLWFEKWKQIHPETPRKEYDSPYLVWKYSEMVTDPILNNKPFSDIFNFNERSYDSFYELLDDECKVMDNLRNIYSKNITIEEKINQGYKYIYNYFNSKENIKIVKK